MGRRNINDSRHAADLCGELVGAGHPGQSRQLLRRDCRRVVHRGAIDGSVEDRDVGSGSDVQHSTVVTALLCHLRARSTRPTPTYVYEGYTPGYLGVVVEPYGTIVYGTGYAYTPWIGSVWYPAPVTYTVARGADLQPVRRLHLWLRDGPGNGSLVLALLRRVLRGLRCLLSPRLLGRLSVLRQRERQRLRTLGQRGILGHAHRGMRAAASQARGRAAATTTRARARSERTTRESNTTLIPATIRAVTIGQPTALTAGTAMPRVVPTPTSTRDSARPHRACPPREGRQLVSAYRRHYRGPTGLRARWRRLDVQRGDRQDQYLEHS